jgi:hypothetical protein
MERGNASLVSSKCQYGSPSVLTDQDLPRPVTPPIFPLITADIAIAPESYAGLRRHSLHCADTTRQPDLLDKLLTHDSESSPSAIIESLKSFYTPLAPSTGSPWQFADPMAMSLLDEFGEPNPRLIITDPRRISPRASHTFFEGYIYPLFETHSRVESEADADSDTMSDSVKE